MKHRPSNLGELLSLSALRHPRRTAIVFGRKKIDYKSLNAAAGRVARGLIGLGINRHDRIALHLDNCPEFVISYFAAMKAGAVAVPINYMFKIEEVRYILEDSGAKLLITSGASLGMAEELRLRVDSLEHIITASKAKDNIPDLNRIGRESPTLPDGPKISPGELAVILYTSGTTGFPKGAMLTHRNLISNAADCRKALRATRRDSFICILPLFHSFAATVCMNLPLSAGAKIVIMKSVKPFKRVIRAIRKNRVTVFVGVPSIYNILKEMKLPRVFGSLLIRLFNPVRLCISGAAALPVETFYEFEKKFRMPLLEGYGLTEASPVVSLNPLRGERRAGSIGVALSESIVLKIVGEGGGQVAPGETGELLVKGPNVMQGYYKKEEATRETIKDGWLYTGDMAKIDSTGYIYIAGRKKEMVNVRGLNVYPREIEEVLYQNPKVKEAAVIGIPDTHKGEVPKCFLVLKDGEKATEHEFMQYLRDRLAAYKIPKYIEFRESLPKNASGKILKRLLSQTIIVLAVFISLSCATLMKDSLYREALAESKSGNMDFAYIKLNEYLREQPQSPHAGKVRFAIGEYLFQINNYHDAMLKLSEYIRDYPNEENTLFARALLYKMLTEYNKEPELIKTITEGFFSQSLFLLFSDTKTRYYKSILNNTYKIVDYVDKIEVFKNNALLIKITP